MPSALLVLNAGSSSLKFAAFTVTADHQLQRLLSGQLAGIGGKAHFSVSESKAHCQLQHIHQHSDAIQYVLQWLEEQLTDVQIIAAGHRVVHGGQTFTQAAFIEPPVMAQLAALVPLAPQHQPHNLAAIQALADLYPNIPQVACFDTAFHSTQPAIATRLPLPENLRQQGLRRYGFHGLSYTYISQYLSETAQLLPRTVVAHLGNGASVCALDHGKSVATSMGFSTLDGLIMGTRCGALDPGVLLHCLRQGMNEAALTELLYQQSGLHALSGISADMRTVLASPEPAAAQTVEQFCYTLVRQIASHAAALQGLDALVFTGGIGEHAAAIRTQTCAQLGWLGVELDETANQQHAELIATAASRVKVQVIPTDEERVIARQTLEQLYA